MRVVYVLAVLSTVLSVTYAKTVIQSGLSYECTSENIIVMGENNTNYRSIFAIGTSGSNINEHCKINTTVVNDSTTFEISGCNISKPINITVMRDVQEWNTDMIIGGQSVLVFELLCNDVPRGGINMTKTVNLDKLQDPEKVEKHQPYLNLTMEILQTNATKVDANIPVLIGSELLLVISATEGYKLYARACSAKTFPNSTLHTKPLVLGGAAVDPSIMTNFSNQIHNTTTHTDKIEAHLYAFHFVDSYAISVECTITVCQADDSSCLSSVSINKNPKRKRNAPSSVPRTHTLITTLRVVDNNLFVGKTLESASACHSSSFWSVPMLVCIVFGVIKH